MLAPQRYRKENKVGEGTYAVVYLGTDTETGTRCAIKKIKVGRDFRDGLQLDAVREIKYLRDLRHPNIVGLLDVYAQKHNVNLVLEYLPRDLEQVIKNRKILFSPADIKSWMLMTLKGLAHLHANFVLHRDIKPNNLLIAESGVLKLADFGLAADYADPLRVMSTQVVTRWYRSPELLLGAKQYAAGVDVWAAACVFAELLLRTPYLPGDSELDQLTVIFRAMGTPTEQEWPDARALPYWTEFKKTYPRQPLGSLFTAASPDCIELLERMFAYDPMQRISADKALEHAYFAKKPRPTVPERLPGRADDL